MTPNECTICHTDAKEKQKGTEREPKGAKGNQKEPNSDQKGANSKPKRIPKSINKRYPKSHQTDINIYHLGNHFPSEIDTTFDAGIEAETNMKTDEQTVRTWLECLLFSDNNESVQGLVELYFLMFPFRIAMSFTKPAHRTNE